METTNYLQFFVEIIIKDKLSELRERYFDEVTKFAIDLCTIDIEMEIIRFDYSDADTGTIMHYTGYFSEYFEKEFQKEKNKWLLAVDNYLFSVPDALSQKNLLESQKLHLNSLHQRVSSDNEKLTKHKPLLVSHLGLMIKDIDLRFSYMSSAPKPMIDKSKLTKLQWMGNKNLLGTLFFRLLTSELRKGQPVLRATKQEVMSRF